MQVAPQMSKMRKYFFFCWHHLVVLLHSFLLCFCFESEFLTAQLFTNKEQKILIRDVFGTFATQTCCAYDVIDTDCRAQSGSNGDRVRFQTSEATHKGVN